MTTVSKILVVEDDAVCATAIASMLQSFGFQVDIVKTGKEAISLFQNNYDLIFLDIGLPDMSGLGVCMAIRNQEQTKHTPIIAITANLEVKDECLSVGIDQFITKPMNLETCKSILQRWLGLFE